MDLDVFFCYKHWIDCLIRVKRPWICLNDAPVLNVYINMLIFTLLLMLHIFCCYDEIYFCSQYQKRCGLADGWTGRELLQKPGQGQTWPVVLYQQLIYPLGLLLSQTLWVSSMLSVLTFSTWLRPLGSLKCYLKHEESNTSWGIWG